MDLTSAAFALSMINLLALGVLGFFLFKTIRHYNLLTQGTNTKDLISSLNQFIKLVRQNQKDTEDLTKQLAKFVKKSQDDIQKVGFIRFNPFAHTGGDQSFALCLLDENNNGVVISSLHSRENTRIYAKKVVEGKSPDQVLSKEEKEVINQAIKS